MDCENEVDIEALLYSTAALSLFCRNESSFCGRYPSVCCTLPQLKSMIADVSYEGANVGLELHPAKTKIQHNDIGYGSRVRSATVAGMDIEVLDPSANTMYLG